MLFNLLNVFFNSSEFYSTFPVSIERWCRLRGNLLFYFKSRDHWSEPAGVIVVENCTIKAAPDQLISPREATYGIILSFGIDGNSHVCL